MTVRLYPWGPRSKTVSVGLHGVCPRFPTPTISIAPRVPGSALSSTPPRVSRSDPLRDRRAALVALADGLTLGAGALVAAAGAGTFSSSPANATSEVRSPILGMCRMPCRSLPVTVNVRTVEVWERFAVPGNLEEIAGDASPFHDGFLLCNFYFLLRISAPSAAPL